jgi:hypothetical protein
MTTTDPITVLAIIAGALILLYLIYLNSRLWRKKKKNRK